MADPKVYEWTDQLISFSLQLRCRTSNKTVNYTYTYAQNSAPTAVSIINSFRLPKVKF